MQPGYSLKPMAVSEGQHILLVHIDDISDFFIEIAGHPCLILPQTLEQKKETTRHRCYQKWYHEEGGQDISGTTPGEFKTNQKNNTTAGEAKKKLNYQRRHKTSLTLVPLGYYLSVYNVIVGKRLN